MPRQKKPIDMSTSAHVREEREKKNTIDTRRTKTLANLSEERKKRDVGRRRMKDEKELVSSFTSFLFLSVREVLFIET